MSTSRRLKEIRERAEKASPAPWIWHDCNMWSEPDLKLREERDEKGEYSEDGPHAIIITDSGVYPPRNDDADFIQNARQDIPDLLALVERLTHSLRLLRTSAVMLQANSEECVKKHGPLPEDGNMPGWLFDTQTHIDAAGKLIKELEAE